MKPIRDLIRATRQMAPQDRRTQPCWHSDLRCPASTTARNKCLLFLSHPGYGSAQTKTQSQGGIGPGRQKQKYLRLFCNSTMNNQGCGSHPRIIQLCHIPQLGHILQSYNCVTSYNCGSLLSTKSFSHLYKGLRKVEIFLPMG